MTISNSTAAAWRRVAKGWQMVVQAAAAQTRDEVTYAATRVAQHGVQIIMTQQRLAPSSAQHWTKEQRETSFQNHYNPPAPVDGLHGAGGPSNPIKTRSAEEDRICAESQLKVKNVSAPTTATAAASLAISTTQPDFQSSNDSKAATDDSSSVAFENQIAMPSSASSLQQSSISNASTSTTKQIPNDNNNDDTVRRHGIPEGRAVPSTRFGRALGFASLGLGLAWGTLAEGSARLVGAGSSSSGSSSSSSSSLLLNDPNSDRLAATLCRMRGAALKMGQMLSIQDEALLPPSLMRALNKVRQGAEAMPQHQLQQQLEQQLGLHWRDRFVRFDALPFAAASIGQVHRASIVDGTTGTIRDVVVKVQYPGVARSIESDLNNLAMLVKFTGLAPKGLFIDNVIRVGQKELQVECDYQRERENQMRIQALVRADPVLVENRFVVPDVIQDLTTEQVITRYVSLLAFVLATHVRVSDWMHWVVTSAVSFCRVGQLTRLQTLRIKKKKTESEEPFSI